MACFTGASAVIESDAGDVGRLPGEFADGGAFDREIVLKAADLLAQLGYGAQQVGVLREESFDLGPAVLVELA